jgi:hypothetical protein
LAEIFNLNDWKRAITFRGITVPDEKFFSDVLYAEEQSDDGFIRFDEFQDVLASSICFRSLYHLSGQNHRCGNG